MYRPQFQPCMEKCAQCADACRTCAGYGVSGANPALSAHYVGLAYDCAAVCGLLLEMLKRGSDNLRAAGALCQAICERCAEEFSGLKDESWNQCAQIAKLCAAECQRMMASLAHGAGNNPTGGPYAA